MKGIVNNVKLAVNGQAVVTINNLPYLTQPSYIVKALLQPAGLPADIFLLEGCELEFKQVKHKAGDSYGTGTYKQDGQKFENPSISVVGGAAKEYRTMKLTAVAKQEAKSMFTGAFASLSIPQGNANKQQPVSEGVSHANIEQKETVAADEVV